MDVCGREEDDAEELVEAPTSRSALLTTGLKVDATGRDAEDGVVTVKEGLGV